jgi:hypothetical protein
MELRLELLFLVTCRQMSIEEGANTLAGRVIKHAIGRMACYNPLANERWDAPRAETSLLNQRLVDTDFTE